MRVYGSNAIRNVAFVGHGASGKTTLVDALAFVSGASRRHGIDQGRHHPHRLLPRRNRTQALHQPRPRLTPSGWTPRSTCSTPPAISIIFGEVVTGAPRGGRRRRGAERHRRRRGRHREGLGGLRPAAPAAHALRLPDGQGARRLRAGLRRREGAPHAQGRAGRNPGRRRPPTSTGSSTSSPATLPPLQEGHQDGEYDVVPMPDEYQGRLPRIHASS